MNSSGAGRLHAFDGLRGVAAFVVVASHFCGALLPAWIPGNPNIRLSWLAYSPFSSLYDGPLAVQIFFVLSGFVIANSAAHRRDPLLATLAGRYARLSLPMAASVALAVALLLAWPDAIAHLRQITGTPWLDTIYRTAPPASASWALREPFWPLNVAHGPLFNPVLWTMRYELIGSVGVYLFYFAAPPKWRALAAFAAGLALALTGRFVYLDFAIGAVLRELWTGGRLKPSRFGWLWLPAGLALAYPGLGPASGSLRYSLAGIAITASVLLSPLWRRAFQVGAAQFLGRISFALYLVHFPLLFTVGAAAYPLFRWPGGLAVFFVLFAALSLAIAYAFTLAVDEPVLRAVKWVQVKARRSVLPVAAPAG